MEYILFLTLGVLALPFRYYLSESQACKIIGTQLSKSDSKTGFQDAISPPLSTTLSISVWLAVIGVLIYLGYDLGWSSMGIGLAVFVGVGVVAGATFIPKPGSDHFIRRIFISISRRHADYIKNNDLVRAQAMSTLLDTFLSIFADRIKMK